MLTCTAAFPPCDQNAAKRVNASAPSLPLPRPICVDVCTAVRSTCSFVAGLLDCSSKAKLQQPATCSSAERLRFNFTDYWKFPAPLDIFVNSTTSQPTAAPLHTCCYSALNAGNTTENWCAADATALDPLNDAVQTQQTLDGTVIPPSTKTCPYPLLPVTTTTSPQIDGIPGCFLPCQLSFYSDSQWDAMWHVGFALSLISTFLDVTLIATWVVTRRHKYSSPLLWFAIVDSLHSITMLMGYFVGLARPAIPGQNRFAGVICKSATEAFQPSDGGFCLAQALLLNYTNFSALGFLCSALLDVVLTIKFPKRSAKHRRNTIYAYHAFSLLSPIPVISAMLAKNTVGVGGSFTYCGVQTAFSFTYWWQVVQYTGLAITAVVLFLYIVVLLFRSSRTLRSSQQIRVQNDDGQSTRLYFRFCWIALTYSTIVFVLTFSSLQVQLMKDEWLDDLGKWITCVLSSSTAVCPKPDLFSVHVWRLGQVLGQSSGIFCFVAFAGREDYKTWLGVLGLGRLLKLTSTTTYALQSTPGSPPLIKVASVISRRTSSPSKFPHNAGTPPFQVRTNNDIRSPSVPFRMVSP